MSRRVAFLGCLLLELLLVFGLFLPLVMRVSEGREITLKTVPVDPRSVFRGDYVALDYEVGRGVNETAKYNVPVYVVLAQNGENWDRVSYSEQKPVLKPGEVCLRGRLQYQRISFTDIAQYFVEEGLGKELEQARNFHRLMVTASVTEDCQAIITGIILGPEAPAEVPFPNRMLDPKEPKPAPVNQ